MKSHETVGVLVARFQGQRLHPGWRSIVDTVYAKHPGNTAIFIGDNGSGERSPDDPLSVDERMALILEAYPDNGIVLAGLPDDPISSARWSARLDEYIAAAFPGAPVILYGSRDSFIAHYTGKYPTESITPTAKYSGTELRSHATMPKTEEGRAAIIYAEQRRMPRVVSESRIAVLHDTKILMVTHDRIKDFWEFPGGICRAESASDLDDATRHLRELAQGVRFTGAKNIAPDRITLPVPAFKRSRDRVRSSFYVATYQGYVFHDQIPRNERNGFVPADRAWIPYDRLLDVVVPWHRPLGERLLQYLQT